VITFKPFVHNSSRLLAVDGYKSTHLVHQSFVDILVVEFVIVDLIKPLVHFMGDDLNTEENLEASLFEVKDLA